MRVYLTGGTGLIGSHVAERLRARGDDVVALVRPASDAAHLESLGCRFVIGDVLDPAEVQAGRIRGCDAVIHAAARVFLGGSREVFLTENVEGTRRVLRGAAAASAGEAMRVIHLSSVAVYGGLSMDRPLTEARWREADPERQNAYGASKHLSERAAWRIHEEGEVRVTTLRPAVVYGERDRAAFPILVRYASLPVVPLLAGGKLRLPLVYAGNVADAVVGALDRPGSIGRAYNVARDEPVTAREIVDWLGAALGRRRRTLPVPAWLPRSLLGLLERLPDPMRSGAGLRRALRSLTTDNPYDSDRARAELDWTHHVPHQDAIARTAAWWRGRDLRAGSARA